MTHKSCFDYRWWKAKNHWCSVDAHLHDGAWSMLLSLVHIRSANTLIMYHINQTTFKIRDYHNQNSLALQWCSFSESGRERVAFSFTYKASQHHVYEWLQPITTNDARPKIVDAHLTLILPCTYPQYCIIQFGIVYCWWCFGSLCTIFMYFLLHHYNVL